MAPVLLALAVAALAFEGLLGNVPSVRDVSGATLPSRWFWRQELLAGHLALFDPFVSLGAPTIANPAHGTFYPAQILCALLPFSTGFSLTWALHAFVAAAGGYALARSFGCRAESALLSGLVWGVGGYTTSLWWNGEKLLAAAWLPWTAWATRAAARATRTFGKELVLGAVSVALTCTAGDPFLLFDAALVSLACALAARPGAEAAPPARVGRAMLGVFGIGVILAAPGLVPAALLNGDTARSGALALAQGQAWSMSPARWLDVFVPSPLGDPLGPAAAYAGGAFADSPAQAQPFAVSLYVGSGMCALATAARGKRLLWAMGSLAVVAALLALGRHTPIEGLARALVPGLAWTRYPEKHAIGACAAIALLASCGLEELLSRRAKPTQVAVVALGGLALAVVAAPEPLRTSTRLGAAHAAIALVALAVAFVAARRAPLAAWLVPLVLAVDLLSSSRALLAWAPASDLEAPAFARELTPRAHRPPPRVLRQDSADFRRVPTLPFNAAGLFGLDAFPGWDTSLSPAVDVLPAALAGKENRLLELLRIDLVMVPEDRDAATTRWATQRIRSGPRAWMVGSVLPAADGAAIARAIAADAFDPETSAVVPATEIADGLAVLVSGAPAALGGCDFRDYEPTRSMLHCEAPTPALVVVSETAMRGWSAWVDGHPTPIVPADLALRGIPIGAGAHDIEMRFEPPGLTAAFLVTALTALVCALAVLRSRH
jgi:hypothetical protein